MRTALIILAVVAVLLVLVGAFNADTRVGVDLLAGSVDVSLFWLAVVAAAGLALAGLAGWTMGRLEGTSVRRKLEGELEATYRRLREAQAKAAPDVQPAAAVTLEQPAAVEQPTLEGAAPVEQPTVEQPAPAEQPTLEQPAPAEQPTVEQPAPAEQATAEQRVTGDETTVEQRVTGDEATVEQWPAGGPPT